MGANDVFKEQIVKHNRNAFDVAGRIGLILAALLVVFICLLIPALTGFMAFIITGIGFGVYFLFSFSNREYEYIFTNGDLDIDCIYGKSRRKRIFSGDVKSDAVEIMVHHAERGYDAQFKKANVKVDCGSGRLNERTYFLLARYKGKVLSIAIEPNDALLTAMSPYFGMRKLIKRK